MIAVARAHGMRVMCGCMIETTLGIAAAAHFSPLLDDADLDGAALLSDDPFDGPGIPDGRVVLGDAPGLGVTDVPGTDSDTPRCIEVALAVPLFRTFTYTVPAGIAWPVAVGSRVLVPFRNRAEIGICLGPGTAPEGVRLKPIVSVVDSEPSLPGPLIDTAQWIADWYAAPIGLTLRGMLPTLLLQTKTPTPRAKPNAWCVWCRSCPRCCSVNRPLRGPGSSAWCMTCSKRRAA